MPLSEPMMAQFADAYMRQPVPIGLIFVTHNQC